MSTAPDVNPAPTDVGWRRDVVETQLDGRWRRPVLVESTGSTNDDSAQIARESKLSAGEWSLVASRNQTAGRGRRGHTWSTAPSEGLLLSVATRLHVPAARWPSASVIVGHAMVEVLRALRPAGHAAMDVGLKWPNDLLVGPDHRKLGGILCERVTEPGERDDDALWIAGVGINLRTPHDPALAGFTTGLDSWSTEAGCLELAASELANRVARSIQSHIDAWQLRGGLLLPELHGAALRFCDTEVGLDLGDGRRVPAWLCGIDPTGALRVRDVVGGLAAGPERSLTPLRILDAKTSPPWHAEST